MGTQRSGVAPRNRLRASQGYAGGRPVKPSLRLMVCAAAIAATLALPWAGVAPIDARPVTRPLVEVPQAPEVPSPRPANAQWISGIARIVDGDTVDIDGTRIRLEGIDAPETAQTCERDGGTWACGIDAARFLAGLTRGESLDCAVNGADIYGRTLATCFAGQRDINAEMVRRGYAWAFVKYSRTYVAVEDRARAARAGVWQGPSQPAWLFRATRWTAASEAAPAGCAIKGNISHSGRIYHMPWSPWYDKVVMRSDKGSRWFCSESEAQAAGWRPIRASR